MADDNALLVATLQRGYLEATAALATSERRTASVRELHARDDSNPHGPWCGECTIPWPCSTWRALDGEDSSHG